MMNNELRPYENYKSIDLPWLCSIPAHWSISRNKNVMFQAKSLVGSNHSNYKLLSLTLNGVIARDMVNPKGKFPKEFDTYQIVNQNDLVFCLFDVDETPRTVGISPFEGMITGAYTVFNVKNANDRYLYYYYLALDNNKMLKPLYTGLRKVISADTFLRTKLPVPPRSEQDQIVKYLDHKLVKINKFIKTKKELIAVLKEQKQAIINQVVTKGLDPDIKMKPSGIDYINSIPEGWSVSKIGYIGKLQNGISESGNFFTKGTPFVSYGDVYNNDHLPMNVSGVADSSPKQQQIYSVKGGDIFFTRTSETIEEIGLSSVCLSDIENAVFSGFLIRFRPNNEILDPVFSKYYFKNDLVRNFFSKEMNIVIRASLGQTLLRNVPVIIPPLVEQREIGRVLDNKTAGIDKVIEKTQSEINLMTEYRNSLISEVVIGKVDVRSIVFDEFEEEEIGFMELDEESVNEGVFEVEDGDE